MTLIRGWVSRKPEQIMEARCSCGKVSVISREQQARYQWLCDACRVMNSLPIPIPPVQTPTTTWTRRDTLLFLGQTASGLLARLGPWKPHATTSVQAHITGAAASTGVGSIEVRIIRATGVGTVTDPSKNDALTTKPTLCPMLPVMPLSGSARKRLVFLHKHCSGHVQSRIQLLPGQRNSPKSAVALSRRVMRELTRSKFRRLGVGAYSQPNHHSILEG